MRSVWAIGLLCIGCTSLWAQAGRSGSVYSRFGIGDLWIPASGASSAMGYSGLASVSQRDWNFMLPASWAELPFMRASARLYLQGWQYSSEIQSARLLSGSIAEVALGFPVGKRLGFGFGFWPYSQVGYRIRQSGQVQEQAYTVRAEGEGGLHQLTLGAGLGLGHGLSLGLGLVRWMGAISREWTVQFTQDSVASFLDSRYRRYSRYAGWGGAVSVLYVHRSPDRRGPVWSFALQWTSPSRLQGYRNWMLQYGQLSSNLLTTDTLEVPRTGRLDIPARWSVGLAWHRGERLGAQLEFVYQPWSRFQSTLPVELDSPRDGWRLGLGGFVVPDPENLTGYLQRIIYRAGVLYEQTPLLLRHRPINRWGITFGLGLPTRDPRISVDINMEIGQRGTVAAGLVREWQYRLSVTLNYAERWFVRRRLE